MAELQRNDGHDCRGKKANVLAIALRVGRVVRVAKKLLAGTADIIRKRDLLAALLSPLIDDVCRDNILPFSCCPRRERQSEYRRDLTLSADFALSGRRC